MRKNLLFLPLLVVSLAGVSTFKLANHIQVLSVDETIDNVKIGDVFEVEPRTLEYEGEKQTVSGQIILPDGTSKEGKQFNTGVSKKNISLVSNSKILFPYTSGL